MSEDTTSGGGDDNGPTTEDVMTPILPVIPVDTTEDVEPAVEVVTAEGGDGVTLQDLVGREGSIKTPCILYYDSKSHGKRRYYVELKIKKKPIFSYKEEEASVLKEADHVRAVLLATYAMGYTGLAAHGLKKEGEKAASPTPKSDAPVLTPVEEEISLDPT